MKRFSLLVLLLIIFIITLFLTTYFQRDMNTLSLNDPQVIHSSIILMVILFFPPIVLSFVHHKFWRFISSIYQLIFFFGFVVLMPTGLSGLLSFNELLINLVPTGLLSFNTVLLRLIPTALLGFHAVLISIVSVFGAVISIWSILITLPESFSFMPRNERRGRV